MILYFKISNLCKAIGYQISKEKYLKDKMKLKIHNSLKINSIILILNRK